MIDDVDGGEIRMVVVPHEMIYGQTMKSLQNPNPEIPVCLFLK